MHSRYIAAALCVLSLSVGACSTAPTTPSKQAPEERDALTADNGGADTQPAPKVTDSDIVPLGTSPVDGPTDAPITVVEFSDFQCPFCSRGRQTVDRLRQKYPERVKVVYKFLPLRMHPQAKPAAQAAVAAHNQGRFWAMHDWLFDRQTDFGSHNADFEQWTAEHAAKLGMDVAQFKRDYASDKTAAIVERDKQLGRKLEVRGTPHFFVNGERVKGAKPLAYFEILVDQQLEKTSQMLAKDDVDGHNLYQKVVADQYDAGSPKPRRDRRVKQKPTKVDPAKLGLGNAPVRGPDAAPVTIVMFNDFECPFCKRADNTLNGVLEQFNGKVKLAYKHFPLPFHQHAIAAAKAAMAAGEQGKFWQMHDLLFENQKKLGQDGIYNKLANQIGLDVDQFDRDRQKSGYDKQIRQDVRQGKKVGVRGTPTFFINGRRLVGARPAVKFKRLISDALDQAE